MSAWTVGVIGLGDMGGGIAANLVRAGARAHIERVLGYDLKPDERERFAHAGGIATRNGEEIVAACDVVMTSLEGHDAIRVAETVLLPAARSEQTFVDLSTVPAPETRRLGQAFLDKGCAYLDAPVSGGRSGAEKGALRVFVGGDRATAERCWPLFEAIANPEKVVYCGPLGMGQVAKVVQQLTVRWPDVARLEVMAYGIRAGLDWDTVLHALDVSPDSADRYTRLYQAIQSGNAQVLGGLYSEWEYFLAEAEAKGFRLPMLEAMYAFLQGEEQPLLDPLERPMPSIWDALIKAER